MRKQENVVINVGFWVTIIPSERVHLMFNVQNGNMHSIQFDRIVCISGEQILQVEKSDCGKKKKKYRKNAK